MARQRNNSNTKITLFFITAVVSIFVVVFAIKNPQSYQQFAASPQNTPYTINLNPTPPAALGATITFNMTYPKTAKSLWVSVLCYLDQAKTKLVYGEGGTAAQAAGDGTSKLGYNGFTLGGASSDWLGNYPTSSTYCSAELGSLYWKGGKEYYSPYASTNFTALGQQ